MLKLAAAAAAILAISGAHRFDDRNGLEKGGSIWILFAKYN